MKRMLAKSMRSVLALLLVGCLMFGLCGTVLAAEAACPADRVEDLIEEMAGVIAKYVPKALAESYDFAAAQVDPVLNAAAALKAKLDTREEAAAVLDKTMNNLKKVAASIDYNEVEATLEQIAEATADLYNYVKDDVELVELYDKLMVEVENLITFFALAYKRATSADYVATAKSSYVAIGDGSAAAENSYVDKVAAELGIKKVANLAEAGLMVGDAYAVVEENAAAIKAADLITVGFNNNTFVEFTLDKVLAGEHDIGDWIPYITEAGAEAMAKIVAELKQELTELGLGVEPVTGIDCALMLTLAIESYAYSCAAYAFNMPLLLNDITDMNDEAVVAIVGMFNPFKGVSLNIGGISLPMGYFVEVLAEATDIYNLTYAMLTCNGTFINLGNGVTTINDKTEMGLYDMINAYTKGTMEPNDAGHVYIKDRIIDALRVTAVLYGDVDGNGVVNLRDTLMLLQFVNGKWTIDEINEPACYLDADEDIDLRDVLILLQYVNGKHASLPLDI